MTAGLMAALLQVMISMAWGVPQILRGSLGALSERQAGVCQKKNSTAIRNTNFQHRYFNKPLRYLLIIGIIIFFRF
jgi:hypothetical protein